ncbi:bacterial regulatory s, gntR family protein, partial [Vibrio parahaemolyticus EKP-028]
TGRLGGCGVACILRCIAILRAVRFESALSKNRPGHGH